MNTPRPLTADQSGMVRDNIKMVHAILKRHPALIRTVGHDEAVSWGYLVLCKAVRTFDPAKGAISTHFYHSFRLATMAYERVVKRDQRVKSFGYTGSDTGLLEEWTVREDEEPGWFHSEEVEAALSCLGEGDREIVRLYHGIGPNHLTLNAIARRLKIRAHEAYRRYRSAITRLRDYAHGNLTEQPGHPASHRERANPQTGCAASLGRVRLAKKDSYGNDRSTRRTCGNQLVG